MLLVIDIGNTNVKSGLFDGNKLIATFRISTDKNKTQDEYGLIFTMAIERQGISIKDVKAVIISSVVPPLMHTFPTMVERYFNVEPMIVDYKSDFGIKNHYSIPSEVGADRLVNGAAGFKKYGGPLILVDIGTAVTFDVITENGEYIGGAIAPGITVASEALFLRASRLPKVELVKPKNVIGKSTQESMQAGLVNGYIGLIDRLLEEIMEELGTTIEETKIISTGGYSELIAKESKYIQRVDTVLTMEGLYLIYEQNK